MGSPSYSPKDCTARYTHRSDHGATTTKNRGAPRLGVSPRFTGEKRVNLPDSHGLQTHTHTHTHTHIPVFGVIVDLEKYTQITGERGLVYMSDIVRGIVDFAHLTWGTTICV